MVAKIIAFLGLVVAISVLWMLVVLPTWLHLIRELEKIPTF